MPQGTAKIKLDPDTVTATLDGELINLSPTEYRILALFVKNEGKVLDRATLLGAFRRTDGHDHTNIVDVYVKHLRYKFGQDTIRTVRGQGYVFGEVAA